MGNYRVIAELGRGGMANVYLALSEGASGFRKLVVIKSLRDHLAASPEFCAMLLEEGRLAARLNHPNVVQTYEVGTYAGRPALVMEYLDGQPLSAVVSRSRHGERVPLSMHLKIITEALVGLDYAHDLTNYDGTPMNLVHRDISPSNVFVTFDGNVKVLDFGIAKATTSSHDTNTGELKGKIAYMAPEQMLGERFIDRRADLFAIGVMIWEAAAGQRMWEGCNEVTIMRRVLNDDIPKLRDVRRDAPDQVVRICERALAVDRSKRYESASEIERDLDAVIAELAETFKKRDVGRYVATLFADVRNKTRRVIEEQTRIVETGDVSLEPVVLAELLDGSTARAEVASPEKLSPAPRRVARRALWAVAVASVLALGGALLGEKRELPSPGPALSVTPVDPSAAAPVGGVPPALEAPPLVDIPLPARSGTAPAPVAPASRSNPARSAPHPAASAAPVQANAPPPSQSSVAPPKASTTCDPPFVLDDQGIRHPKPSCL
jgi:eukaryotic-like serine/threonine-protein kinase